MFGIRELVREIKSLNFELHALRLMIFETREFFRVKKLSEGAAAGEYTIKVETINPDKEKIILELQRKIARLEGREL